MQTEAPKKIVRSMVRHEGTFFHLKKSEVTVSNFISDGKISV